MYIFLDYRELERGELNPEKILGRMSEAGQCLLTGKTEELVYVPVDGDPNNLLPSNMVCLSKSLVDSFDCSYLYEETFYVENSKKTYRVTFDTPFSFFEYNTSALKIAQNKVSSELSESAPKALIKLFEVFTESHVKGILRVKCEDSGLQLDRIHFQNYVLKTLSKKKSPIIPLS